MTSGVPLQTGQAVWPHVHQKRKARSSRLRRREQRAQALAEAAEQAAASPLSSAQKTPDVAEQATVATCPAVQAVATPTPSAVHSYPLPAAAQAGRPAKGQADHAPAIASDPARPLPVLP